MSQKSSHQLAALERLKALYAAKGSFLDLALAEPEIKQLGLMGMVHGDSQRLIWNFDSFLSWYAAASNLNFSPFRHTAPLINKSPPPVDDEIGDVKAKSAALKRLLFLRTQHGASLGVPQASGDIKLLGIKVYWDADIQLILDNFDHFVRWYKPGIRQSIHFYRDDIKSQKNYEAEKLRGAIEEKEDIDFNKRLLESIKVHAHTLHRKRRKIVYTNDYGVEKGRDKWEKEVRNFVIDTTSPLKRHLASYEHACIWLKSVDDFLDGSENSFLAAPPALDMSGAEYELLCQDILENAGWEVLRNGGTGDQGVDLIATLNGLRVAIQCKRYTSSVGNKAVQEIVAGMIHENCNRAVVVSNAPYTAGAIALARTNKVVLTDDGALDGLYRLL